VFFPCGYGESPQNAYSVSAGHHVGKQLGVTVRDTEIVKKKCVLKLKNIKRNREITFFRCKGTHCQMDFILVLSV
jgi:hypothetical protein